MLQTVLVQGLMEKLEGAMKGRETSSTKPTWTKQEQGLMLFQKKDGVLQLWWIERDQDEKEQ